MPETASGRKRRQRRDRIFPGAPGLVRSGTEVGWFKAPRALPFVLQLLREKEVVGTMACDQVYLELIARDPGEGFVEVVDEQEHAFVAGYASNRAVRTWRERVAKLAELGFIRVAPKEPREYGFVLLLDPQKVVEQMERSATSATLLKLFSAMRQRRREVGAEAEPDTESL